MSTKIKLGQTPKNFAPVTVTFDMPDGTKGVIEATYKYRTRDAYGQMMNKLFDDAGEERQDVAKIDFEQLYKAAGDKNADHLMAALEAWDQDFSLTRENLLQLSNEIPAAAIALMSHYRAACIEGRLKN